MGLCSGDCVCVLCPLSRVGRLMVERQWREGACLGTGGELYEKSIRESRCHKLTGAREVE